MKTYIMHNQFKHLFIVARQKTEFQDIEQIHTKSVLCSVVQNCLQIKLVFLKYFTFVERIKIEIICQMFVWYLVALLMLF